MALALDAAAAHGGEPARSERRRRGGADPASARAGRGPGQRLAQRLPLRALPARLAGRLRRALGHLRDRDHLGPLPGLPRRGDGDRPAGGGRGERAGRPRATARPGSAAASPTSTRTARRRTTRCSPRPGAATRSRSGTRSRRRSRSGDRRRRHDHPPPRRRPRPPPLVRPPAPGPFADALRAAKRELDPKADPESRRADRSHEVRTTLAAVHGRAPDEERAEPEVAQRRPAGQAPKPRRGPVRAAIVALRPQEWVKNLLVFAGLLFSAKFKDFDAVVAATVTFAAFCAVASAGYLVNDAHDVEEDRQHPTKRFRPIAAGELGIPTAIVLAVVLAVAGLAGSARSRASRSAGWCSPTASAPPSTPTSSSTR